MKQKSILILIVAIFVAVTSCKEESHPIGGIKRILGFGNANDDIPHCLFRICSASDWTTSDMLIPGHNGNPYFYSENYCWVYLSDGIDFRDPALITCNGSTMDRLEKGQYEYYQMPGHISTIDWHITGFLGYTYTATDVNLPSLAMTNINYNDTLYKSEGINIKYDGYLGGDDSILVKIYYTYYFGVTVNSLDRYSFDKYVPDNGNIVLTPSDLASFPTSIIGSQVAYGTITLHRKKYVEEDFNGMTFGKLYETSTTNSVNIK
jgi:hypothetical protein